MDVPEIPDTEEDVDKRIVALYMYCTLWRYCLYFNKAWVDGDYEKKTKDRGRRAHDMEMRKHEQLEEVATDH